MASIAEQKQASRDIISTHMEALADVAIHQEDVVGLKTMTMQLLDSLTGRMTLSELKEWQAHVESKYGYLLQRNDAT